MMKETINYRLGTTADAAGLAAAIGTVISQSVHYNALAITHETKRYNALFLGAKMAEDPCSVILATDGDTIAGFCLSRFDDYTIWLEWFGVLPGYRSRGIAASLLDELENYVTVRQCHKIWCDCRTDNNAAIQLLGRAAYQQVGTLQHHWYGQDFFIWDKRVIPATSKNHGPDE